MGQTNWTTKTSGIAESGFKVDISFWVDENDNPINPADADDNDAVQLRRTARVRVQIALTPDAIADRITRYRTYRLAGAPVAGKEYGAQDGSDGNNPAPFTLGTQADLDALKAVVVLAKKQIRLDVNGDVEA